MNRRDFLRGVASCAVAVAAPLPLLNTPLVFTGVDFAKGWAADDVTWQAVMENGRFVGGVVYSTERSVFMDFREAEERVMAYLSDPDVPHEEKTDLLRVEFSPTGRLLLG